MNSALYLRAFRLGKSKSYSNVGSVRFCQLIGLFCDHFCFNAGITCTDVPTAIDVLNTRYRLGTLCFHSVRVILILQFHLIILSLVFKYFFYIFSLNMRNVASWFCLLCLADVTIHRNMITCTYLISFVILLR